MYTIALAGNPNCGKTTLFNQLTGSNQHVGNWSGVTVEKKEGRARMRENEFLIVDLPGVYSLSPYSMEEICARDYILSGEAEAVINVIDGTNLERNLYLTMQLLELGKPVIIAVNMMDEVQARGWSIDCAALEKMLRIPAVPVVSRTGKGFETLLQKTALACEAQRKAAGRVQTKAVAVPMDEAEAAEARYALIETVTQAAMTKPVSRKKLTRSEKIDRVVTNRVLALPLFFCIMLLIFSAVFGPVGQGMRGTVEQLTKWTATSVLALLQQVGTSKWVCSLVVDAVIGGVGGVLAFLPQMALLFLFLSLLEDSGYMARAAFIMDRPLRTLGLTGRSFIPMLMGFGCTTPAVMATRALSSEKDRRLTIMLTPLMSCGARMPIYALFAGVFFPEHQGLVVLSLYLLGVVVAVVMGLVLKNTVFGSQREPFFMELPEYRMPTLKNTMLHLWDKCVGFAVKAGTVIFLMSILAWILQNFDFSLQPVSDSAKSMLGGIGTALAPALKPLGFGTWQAAAALLAGVVAKEAIVSTMGVLYGAKALTSALSVCFTPLSAYAFMAFSLLYMPCVAAFATIRREMNSMRWALATAALHTGVAYALALTIYQVGSLFLR